MNKPAAPDAKTVKPVVVKPAKIVEKIVEVLTPKKQKYLVIAKVNPVIGGRMYESGVTYDDIKPSIADWLEAENCITKVN